ncbi:MAG: sigma-70 family RNA polymerase sigma factor [Bacteroidota bacterium]
MQSLLNGDEKGISAIYQQVFPKVVRFILKNNGQREDAEDIFHKALLQLTTRIRVQTFEINTTFEGYLFTACKNLWRRELNKKSNHWVTEKEEVELVDDDHDQAMAILDQERWELYQECFQKLSDNCKEVLTYFFGKMSYQEIVAKTTYTSEVVVRQRVFKCKKKLTMFIKADKRFKTLSYDGF